MDKRAAVTDGTAVTLGAWSDDGHGTIPGLPIVGDELVAHAQDDPRLNIHLELLQDAEVFIRLGRLFAFLDLDGVHLISLNDQQVDLLLVDVAVVEQVNGLARVVVWCNSIFRTLMKFREWPFLISTKINQQCYCPPFSPPLFAA